MPTGLRAKGCGSVMLRAQDLKRARTGVAEGIVGLGWFGSVWFGGF